MGGFLIDDPMLALIARFAGCCDELSPSEEVFLHSQCDQIRAYVERFPSGQRQERAMEWITRNAEDYRRKWRQKLVSEEATGNRCADCPLEQRDDLPCEIHERWLALMNQYLAGETSSEAYVEDTLELLRRHKERLKQSVLRVANG